MKKILLGLVSAALFAASCSNRIDQTKFEPVYRAGKALAGATAVGVNLMRFRELLQAFASEVSIANDRARSDNERQMTRLYVEALQAYKDSETIWRLQIEGNESVPISQDPELKRIVEAYPIDGTGTGSAFRFSPKDALQSIWRFGQGKLTAAERLYGAQE